MNINGVCTTPSPIPVASISVTPSSCTIAAGYKKVLVRLNPRWNMSRPMCNAKEAQAPKPVWLEFGLAGTPTRCAAAV